MQARQNDSASFLVQAIGTAAWWILLVAYPSTVKWFRPNAWPVESDEPTDCFRALHLSGGGNATLNLARPWDFGTTSALAYEAEELVVPFHSPDESFFSLLNKLDVSQERAANLR